MEEISSLVDHERKKSLPLYRRVAFGTGNFINVLAISMWFPYNVSFFQKVIQLSSRSAGTIVLIAQIGGALSTPFVGLWSDNCTCRIPGRRKVFQLIGIISLACSFFFIWYDCLGCQGVSEPYKVLYYSCFAIVFEFGWAATQVGQLSLIPELTTSKAIQVELNSIRYTFNFDLALSLIAAWVLHLIMINLIILHYMQICICNYWKFDHFWHILGSTREV